MHFEIWDSTKIFPTKPVLADEISKRTFCYSDSINPSYTPTNVLFLYGFWWMTSVYVINRTKHIYIYIYIYISLNKVIFFILILDIWNSFVVRYRRGHGFKSRTRLNFFQVLFSTTRFSSVLSCEDLLHSIFHIVVALRDYNSSLIFPSLNNI